MSSDKLGGMLDSLRDRINDRRRRLNLPGRDVESIDLASILLTYTADKEVREGLEKLLMVGRLLARR